MTGPLSGTRVLDLTSNVAGPYATKLLADFGVDVIKVEPPDGDPARGEAPFFGEKPHIEGSLRFLHLNTSKRSVTLDLDSEDGVAALRKLIAGADILIEDFAPGRLAALGLDFEALSELRPGLVLTSITPWGQTGPYAGYQLTDLTAQAMAGPLIWTGSRDREPLKNAGSLAMHQAGGVAALATIAAYLRQERSGEGDWVDVSIYETQAGSRDRVTPYLTNHSYSGYELKRAAAGVSLASGVRPCRDGYVHILGTGNPRRLNSFLMMIGRPELVGDERLKGALALVDPALVEDIEASYLGWLMQREKRDAIEEAQQHNLLAGPINSPADLVSEPHFIDRGAWEQIDHPHTDAQTYPGRPFIMSDSPRPIASRAPTLGEHSADVLDALNGDSGADAAWAARDQPTPAESDAPRGRLPLDGVRVLDSTVVWAGPYCTQLLAEWGAEVIRVEPITRFQPQTRQMERATTRDEQIELHERGTGSPGGHTFPDLDPGARPWDRNSGFNSHARNKRSVTADVSTEEGREMFYRLVAHADVFVENNVPETIEKAGITYEELKAINPDLIMLRMPAYGLNGPFKNYRGLGLHVEATVAHHYLRGYPVGTPDEAGSGLVGDAIAGIQGALAVVMALRHRLRSGRGQQIELAQAENFLPIIAEPILEWTMNGSDPGPRGNRHPSHAPHQVYPTSGEDEWIAIDVATDGQFTALCDVLDGSTLATDPRFATAGERLANLDALDAAIGELTRPHEKFALFHSLQAAGVAAGPVQTAAEKHACPQLDARGFYEELENEVTGRHWYPGLIWRMANTPNSLRSAPVTLGQDNEYVWKQLVGMSDEEYREHEQSGQIGDSYPTELVAHWPSVAAAQQAEGAANG